MGFNSGLKGLNACWLSAVNLMSKLYLVYTLLTAWDGVLYPVCVCVCVWLIWEQLQWHG